jgi:hypothetical protein
VADGLDILVAAPAAAAHLNECLDALEKELSATRGESYAVTLTVARAGTPPPDAASRFPHAHWIACDAGASLPALYGKALSETAGTWIAFLDSDCAVSEGWLKAALVRCVEPEIIIGGAVEPGRLKSHSAWAAYFCDYGAFLPPLPPSTASAVAGNNLLLRRSALSQAPAYATPQFWKTLFVHSLATQGVRSLNAPELVIRYDKNLPGRVWLRRRFDNGRCFAAMVELIHASEGRRLARVLATPLVPLILLVRLLRDSWPRGRYRAELVGALPWIVSGLAAWAAGECTGLILGAGTTCERVY